MKSPVNLCDNLHTREPTSCALRNKCKNCLKKITIETLFVCEKKVLDYFCRAKFALDKP